MNMECRDCLSPLVEAGVDSRFLIATDGFIYEVIYTTGPIRFDADDFSGVRTARWYTRKDLMSTEHGRAALEAYESRDWPAMVACAACGTLDAGELPAVVPTIMCSTCRRASAEKGRKGECNTCNMYRRRHGEQRPEKLVDFRAAVRNAEAQGEERLLRNMLS